MRIVFFLSLSFFFASPCFSMSLSDIRADVRRAVEDTDTTDPSYSNAVLNTYINEAQKEMSNAVWVCDKTTGYILTPGVTYYNLPSDFLAVELVVFEDNGGNSDILKEYSMKVLYEKLPDWEDEIGQPTDYWVSQATNPTSASSSTVRISYIPIPDQSSTGTVTVWYYNQPAELASDSDVPFDGRRILYPYHQGLVYQVAARIKVLDGMPEEATAYMALYQNYLGFMGQRFNQKPNYNPAIQSGKPK